MSTTARRLVLLAALIAGIPGIAHADPAGDEARRQSIMADSRASAAAIDRRNSDQAFQAGLTRSSPGGGNSGSSSSGSSSGSSSSGGGFGGGGGAASSGPQSVVSTRTVRVWVGETMAQTAQRLRGEAAAGNAQSQYLLGRMNYVGYGTSTTLPEARAAYRQGRRAHRRGIDPHRRLLRHGLARPRR